jgi:MFS family permease
MLPALLAAMFMAQFDLYVVNVAGPSLEHDLHMSDALLELVVAGYGFTYASGLVTGGRLGDLYGPRRMFIAGTLAFSVISVLAGLAQSPGQLVAARLAQGLAGALMVPQVLATITAVFPREERAKALSWFGVTIGGGAVAGQIVGGVLLQADIAGLGWRPIFLVNGPIGIAAAAAAVALQPATRPTSSPRLDPLGAIGISAGLALILAPLALGRSESWPLWTWVALAASIPVLVLTLRWEQSHRQPLVDLMLFRNASFTRGLVVSAAAFAGFFSLTFALSLLLQGGLHLTPLRAGLTFGPLGVAFSVASISAQRLVARHGVRLVVIGLGVSTLGNVLLWSVLVLSGAHLTATRLIGPMVLIGAGNGLGIPALLGSVLARIAPDRAGTAAGLVTTTQQFASAAGVTGIGSIFFAVLNHQSYPHAMEWVVAVDVLLMSVATAGALSLLNASAAPGGPTIPRAEREQQPTATAAAPPAPPADRPQPSNSNDHASRL